jgi:hypothetical protein
MAQVLPSNRIKGQPAATRRHKTFELPYHSSFSYSRSTEYHRRLNPTRARLTAETYPQTGLGG